MFAYNTGWFGNNLKDTVMNYPLKAVKNIFLIFKMQGKSHHPGLEIAKHTGIFIRWISHQKI